MTTLLKHAAIPRRACIIGHPVAHSRSPLIHGYWLKMHGIAGSYERWDVAPDALSACLAGFAQSGFVGGNVTVPHKEVVRAALGARVTPAAAAIGAVNTLWLENGVLHGDNTDAAGFIANLDAQAPGWRDQADSALVLGAGGAARAILHALIERKVARIALANRNLPRAEALAYEFGPAIRPVAWDERIPALEGVGLVVNTTSLGMTGQPPLDLPLAALPPHAVVADIVYAPLETPLLAAARARGLRCVDGLGMLLHQAVPGFARWFGVTPRVTPELRALIVADLEHR